MENPSRTERWNRAGMEDNMLAMFDASEAKDANQDALDDRTHHIPLFFFFFCFFGISFCFVLLPIFA